MSRSHRVFIAPPALGMGDLIVTLPVVQSLIRSGAQTWLIVRGESHLALTKHIAGLAGTMLEWQFDPRKMKPGDVHYDMRNHPLQQDWWWGSDDFERAFPTYRINDILQHICTDLGIAADLTQRQPLTFTRLPQFAQTVVFLPGSAFSFKCWPTANWLALDRSFRQDGGAQQCLVIGEPEQSQAVAQLVAAGLNWLPTPTLADALNIISSAGAVVAVDTGLMHLAVHQGVPTVALYRHNPVYLRRYSHVQAVVAENACAPACFAAEKACAHNTRPQAGIGFAPRDWSCAADYGVQCMSSLSLERVQGALHAALQSAYPNAAPTPVPETFDPKFVN